jgi:hypothetical protein
MWKFSTTTGRVFLDVDGLIKCVAVGYSGFGPGKLNPTMEAVPDVGPCPRGLFKLELIQADGVPVDYEHKKAPVFRLVPKAGTNLFGRAGFLIHGDSVSAPGTASHGCVILAHDVRERIRLSGVDELEVL